MADTDIHAQSDFSSDADGWTVQTGYPTASATTAPFWQRAATGFSGGVVFYAPPEGRPDGEIYLAAPAKFLGDLSKCHGQNFSFQLLLEVGHKPAAGDFYAGTQGLIVVGGGDALELKANVADLFNVSGGGEVQNIAVKLDETTPCVLRSSGAAPSAAQFKAVLANVGALLLRIDYYPAAANWTSFLGAPTLYQSALDPVLAALYERLDAARKASPTGAVTLDASTLGTAGAGVVAVMPAAFGSPAAPFAGEGLSLVADATAQTVTLAGNCQDDALSLSQPSLAAVFTADASGVLVMKMTIGADGDWNLGQSFPLLARSYFSNIGYQQDSDPPPCLVLSSVADAGAASGEGYAQGLNVRGVLGFGQWPLASLGQLISGLAPSLATTGSVTCAHTSSAADESLVIAAPLPDFALPATILPALEFKHNRLALYARYSMRTQESEMVEYQAIDLCAESRITLNGVALPFAVYLPVPGSSWGVGLPPRASVPIGDLATFLGGFTGVSLADALPNAVRALNVFELKALAVRLSGDRQSFSSFILALGTIPVAASSSVWKIIDGVIELHDLDFCLNVTRGKSGDVRTSGYIQGSINLGGSLNVGASVPLPIGQGVWTFAARSTQPINALDAIGALFGNNKLSQSLPAGLGALASYNLQDLSFVFDPAAAKLTRVHLAISSAEPWHIVADQLVVESLYLDLAVDDPMGAGISPYGAVGCALKIGTVYIAGEVSRADAGAPWLLLITAAPVALPTLGDMTALLAGQSVADALPGTLAGNGFSLFGVSVAANLSTPKVDEITFGLSTTGAWTLITDILVVQSVEVYFDFDWRAAQDSLAISGYIAGAVTFIGSNFMLRADKRCGGWDLAAQLDSTTPFTLQNVITKFGSAELWNSVAALGVPNVSISQGGITYATDTGNYALDGTVEFTDPVKNLPWTIDIGITTLTIRSIGEGISSVRGADGIAQNTRIYVTGAFDIGSVQFKVGYDTSKGIVVDCTLIADDKPVSAYEITQTLLGNEVVNSVNYTSGFTPLNQILFSGVHAQLIVGTGGNKSSFQLYGKITVESVVVDALLAVRYDATVGWGFIVGVKVDSHWSLPGFTDTLDSFSFDKQTWMVSVTSFTDPAFAFPAAFALPNYKGVFKYLDFYASFSTGNTDPAVDGVDKLLPTKQLPPSLTVMGVIADQLAQSWLKCMLYADAEGVPIFGWDNMRLSSVAFVITGEPAVALQAVFLYKGIYNVDPHTGAKTYFQLQLTAGVTEAYAFIVASGVDGKPIFTWNDALGLDGFTVQLDWVKLGLLFAELGIEGGFEGLVRFSNPPRTDTAPTPMRGALPHPAHVAAVRAKLTQRRAARARALAASNYTPIPGVPTDLAAFCEEQQPPVGDAVYERAYDPDEILLKMLAVIAITPETEGIPIPQELGAHLVNVTIPYLLKQFVNIDVPSIIQPIQLPDVCFYIGLGQSASVFEFYFHGVIVIFYWHGEVEALFQLPRIKFVANMDSILIGPSSSDPLIVVAKAHDDLGHGPDIHVDSQPPSGQPMIKGDIYCSFLKIFNFEAHIEVAAGPPPLIKFSSRQTIGSLANYYLEFTYQNVLYVHAAGGFVLNLTDQQGASNIPGFSVSKNGQNYRIASSIDLTKVTAGILLSAETVFTLDANPASPRFLLQFTSNFLVKLGQECNIACHLDFNIGVESDTLEKLPLTIVSQLGQNSLQVFGALVQTAECFAYFIKECLLLLLDAADAARALAGYFVVAIDSFVDLLDDIGNGLDDVSDWLWDIFGSHDSKKNTRALRDNTGGKYSGSEVAHSVKKTQDTHDPQHPYTAENLMQDQAGAGYSSLQAMSALKSVFAQYQPDSMAVAAGKLAANPALTAYRPGDVALALKANYPAQAGTAQAMYGLLTQVYGAATLTARQMATALAAAGYPAGDVAKVLRDNYPNDVKTAAAMATILVAAYQGLTPALTGDGLAAALAPFYDAPAVAKAVYDNFASSYQNQPALMAATLAAAYTATGKSVSAQLMTTSLAGCGYMAVQTAPVIHQRYPADTATAVAMAGLLLQSYGGLQVGDMAAALVACGYDATDIGQALLQYYGTVVSTPRQMAAVFAGSGIALGQCAKALKALFAASIGNAAAMIAILNDAYTQPAPTAAQMATAVAGAPYTPVEAAPGLKGAYPAETATAALMAALLTGAYGAGAINAATMAQALAASPYAATDTGGVLRSDYAADSDTAAKLAALLKSAPYPAAANAAALRRYYPADTQHAGQMAPVLAAAGYSVAEVAPVLKVNYPGEVATAAAMYAVLVAAYTNPAPSAAQMAAALAASPFAPAEVAPLLKTNYSTATASAADMYALLSGAYAPAPSAQAMAGALAASPYAATEVAPLLRTHYPADAGTAAKMATLLTAAYANLTLAACLAGLGAAAFSAYASAAAMPAHYAPPAATSFATDLNAAYSGAAALGGIQVGIGLAAATYDATGQSQGIHAVQPTTPAGLMAAYLLALSEATLASALAAADAQAQAGASLNAGAARVAQSVSGIGGETLCLAVNSAYAPPNPSAATLAQACAGAFAAPLAASIATGLLVAHPATPPAQLLDILTAGFAAAGKALDAQTAGAAVAAAFAAIGAAPTQSALVGLMLAKYGAQATPALLVNLLIAAYGTAATVSSVVAALVAGYAQAGLSLSAVLTAVALKQGFALAAKDTASTLTALGNGFILNRVPNDVAALGAATNAAGFGLNDVSAAMKTYYGPAWTIDAYQELSEVYSQALFQAALASVLAGTAVRQAGTSLKSQYPGTAAPQMVHVLASAYTLTATSAGVVPVAQAMKTAGYTLAETSAAMKTQYQPDWTVEDYQKVSAVFNQA
jgi:hypothetical protein